ncbi:AbrB family transcriptional regulator [Aquabacter cavernae]|uniref:AbrB family transcriptional regulator n=1 Tax=Aquabacter cavernae TaxID=2496029 RepID=UPI000F8F7C1C|nr:AbrB family transcriptional regulator [Aquabacter cavernae]
MPRRFSFTALRTRFRVALKPTLLTLAVASAGAIGFFLLGLPAPWMSGALVAVTVQALSGAPSRLPEPLRFACFLVLGASMGTALTPDMLRQAATWPVSMGFLALSVVGVMGAVTLFLRKVAGWSLATAYYASAPGALSAVLAMAAASEADMRRVAFAQAVRLFLLVALLTQILGRVGSVDMSAPVAMPAGTASSVLEVALLLLASLAGGLLAARARIPGGMLIGALAASALLHAMDWSHAQIPDLLMVPAFVILGAGVGVRFKGTTLATLKDCLLASLGAFVVALAISLACALAAAAVTGEDAGKMITAFAPGALETMTVLGFALGYDPAFMSAHHIFRFAGLSVALPVFAHLLFQVGREKGD